MDSFNDQAKIIELEKENELNFVNHRPRHKVNLLLIDGSAEIFGSQLIIDKQYEFSYFSSVTVFSWSGCTLKIQRSHRQKYKIGPSEELPKFKELHDRLKSFRMNAELKNAHCPITLLTGPTDVGKSTLCRYLLNYAARDGSRPIFVDLDVGQSSLSITGTFGVLPIRQPSNVHGRFNEKTLSVYYFGYKSPGHNMTLFKLLLQKLGKALKARIMKSNNVKNSGIIIDTCGWVDGAGYNLIIDIIRALDVNIVYAVGDNSLYSKLMNDLSNRTEVMSVSALEGASHRNKTVRCDNRNSSINDYFYGLFRTLHPYTITVNFSDLQVYKVKSSKEISNLNVISLPIDSSILYQVFGISYAEEVKDILITSVYGFICLVDLNMDSNIALFLSPQPGPLPTKYLLMGDIVLIPHKDKN